MSEKKKEKTSEIFWLIMMVIQIIITGIMIPSVICTIKNGVPSTNQECTTYCCKAISCDCKENEKTCKCKYMDEDGNIHDNLSCPNSEESRSKSENGV